MDAVRVDKWLWAARFFKTRTLATDAVANGRVRMEGNRIKASRDVRVGDCLHIDNGAEKWVVDIVALADKRGSATIAQGLYRETEESITARQAVVEGRRWYSEPAQSIAYGRPTKRDRRMLEKSRNIE